MTAREVLDGIKDRLTKATPGPWRAERYLYGPIEDGRIRVTSPSDTGIHNLAEDVLPSDAVFIAAAPVDVARLTRAVEAVLGLADAWDSRGKHLMNYSEECPESVKLELYEQGEEMADYARKIRAAIEDALNPKEGQ